MTCRDFANTAGAMLERHGLVYGSERRRDDCLAWITDTKRDVKATAWAETEDLARWAAFQEWRERMGVEWSGPALRGGLSDAEIKARAS